MSFPTAAIPAGPAPTTVHTYLLTVLASLQSREHRRYVVRQLSSIVRRKKDRE
ncbi:Uncharacterised protein [Mycobacteroides abscessus subsp. abscessus]|nr:Uncharacterised protein [Mycobacteroides abscessus subsp. abscessus]